MAPRPAPRGSRFARSETDPYLDQFKQSWTTHDSRGGGHNTSSTKVPPGFQKCPQCSKPFSQASFRIHFARCWRSSSTRTNDDSPYGQNDYDNYDSYDPVFNNYSSRTQSARPEWNNDFTSRHTERTSRTKAAPQQNASANTVNNRAARSLAEEAAMYNNDFFTNPSTADTYKPPTGVFDDESEEDSDGNGWSWHEFGHGHARGGGGHRSGNKREEENAGAEAFKRAYARWNKRKEEMRREQEKRDKEAREKRSQREKERAKKSNSSSSNRGGGSNDKSRQQKAKASSYQAPPALSLNDITTLLSSFETLYKGTGVSTDAVLTKKDLPMALAAKVTDTAIVRCLYRCDNASKLLRKLILALHPDKFQQRLGARLDPSCRDETIQEVTALFQHVQNAKERYDKT